MSYCRFSEADVYVFPDVRGYLSCCGCWLDKRGNSAYYSTDDMIAHLREHIAAGHHVPDHVIPALERDREENDHWIKEGEHDPV